MFTGIVIVVICLLFLIRDEKNKITINRSIVVAVVVLVTSLYNSGSDNENKREKETIINSDFTPESDYYSEQDSNEIINSLRQIDKRLDEIYNQTEKSKKQYIRFAKLFATGETSDYQFYKAIKAAKESMDEAHSIISNIEPSVKMHKSLSDTLNIALSNIGIYYYTMANAYEVVMGIMDNDNGNGNLSKIDVYKEKEAMATESYLSGMSYLFIVENKMGMVTDKKQKRRN